MNRAKRKGANQRGLQVPGFYLMVGLVTGLGACQVARMTARTATLWIHAEGRDGLCIKTGDVTILLGSAKILSEARRAL